MKFDLQAIAAMSEDDRARAIDGLVTSLIAEGIIDERTDEFRAILVSICAKLAQRKRPDQPGQASLQRRARTER